MRQANTYNTYVFEFKISTSGANIHKVSICRRIQLLRIWHCGDPRQIYKSATRCFNFVIFVYMFFFDAMIEVDDLW